MLSRFGHHLVALLLLLLLLNVLLLSLRKSSRIGTVARLKILIHSKSLLSLPVLGLLLLLLLIPLFYSLLLLIPSRLLRLLLFLNGLNLRFLSLLMGFSYFYLFSYSNYYSTLKIAQIITWQLFGHLFIPIYLEIQLA
ncbi:hypothetical protein PA905_49540 [Planktothrix agardhii CCAP 1459/11A]|uniref:Uncharacterized protein n=1 Tax=Planktothrix agardhii CCAP 1459/11A TaxID=282420 RepID=A0A4P5ZMI9_PLAAG|nr:hypothetical protein PA905_49540 [Planktothrix agardhii CCAP 1459/11A]